jgi:hypothetical protein
VGVFVLHKFGVVAASAFPIHTSGCVLANPFSLCFVLCFEWHVSSVCIFGAGFSVFGQRCLGLYLRGMLLVHHAIKMLTAIAIRNMLCEFCCGIAIRYRGGGLLHSFIHVRAS